jgi:hypothetical protein
MKLNLLIAVELSEKEKMCAQKDLLSFFQQHLTLTGINNDNLHILIAESLDMMTITEFEFPENLKHCMHNNGIYTIYDLQKFSLTQLYEIISSCCNMNDSEEYVIMINNAMKKCGISYNDIDAALLIPIKDCGFSARTYNSLTRAGYIYLQDITLHTRNHVFKTRNLGIGSQKELEEKLIEHGLWYSDK